MAVSRAALCPEFGAEIAMPAQSAALPVSRPEGLPADAEPVCLGIDLGFRDYEESLKIQDRIVARRKSGSFPDCLLFVDYPPIITLGRGGKRDHLLAGPEELRERGVRVYPAGRGGDITYHGPGTTAGLPRIGLERLAQGHSPVPPHPGARCLVETLSDFGFPPRLCPASPESGLRVAR